MPTPFMHMAFAERVQSDAAVPPDLQTLISSQWGPFLLGSIAPDARVSGGIRRADTHFFEYEPVIQTPPYQAMLSQFPMLARSRLSDAAQVAFLAGYAAHLAMDEIWCVDMLFAHFMQEHWGDKFLSFQMLHMILGYLDARDYALIPPAQHPALVAATPDGWLPFIPDAALGAWRDLVARQLPPGGHRETLDILSQRIKMDEGEMEAFIASETLMTQNLWRNLPRTTVESVETRMYERAREALLAYLNT